MKEDHKSKFATTNVSEVSPEDIPRPKPRLQRHSSAKLPLQTKDWWPLELAYILISFGRATRVRRIFSASSMIDRNLRGPRYPQQGRYCDFYPLQAAFAY